MVNDKKLTITKIKALKTLLTLTFDNGWKPRTTLRALADLVTCRAVDELVVSANAVGVAPVGDGGRQAVG